jgi:hypothetical protein
VVHVVRLIEPVKMTCQREASMQRLGGEAGDDVLKDLIGEAADAVNAVGGGLRDSRGGEVGGLDMESYR